MSYKDFSNLNDAISQASLSPDYEAINRIANEVSEMLSLTKSLPVDWARAYAGVMVLKYASDGTPTDVTDSVTQHGSDAPNSLIDDCYRRFMQLYNQYKKDTSLITAIPSIATGNVWAATKQIPLGVVTDLFNVHLYGERRNFQVYINAEGVTKFNVTDNNLPSASLNNNLVGTVHVAYIAGSAPSHVKFSLFLNVAGELRYLIGHLIFDWANDHSGLSGEIWSYNASTGASYFDKILNNVTILNNTSYSFTELPGSGMEDVSTRGNFTLSRNLTPITVDASSMLTQNDTSVEQIKSALQGLIS